MMKNGLIDLQNHLFEMIETLKDNKLTGARLEQEIKRSLRINELARTAVRNGELMLRAADILYGLPVADELPLIPLPGPEEKPANTDGKRKALLRYPRDDGTDCYKRGRQQFI